MFSLITLILNYSGRQSQSDKWYQQQFQKAESFIEQGLPRSAAEVYDTIFTRALQEQNKIMQIKVINDRLISRCYYEPEALQLVIDLLKKDLPKLEPPVQQIAHSLLGQIYWQYYQNDRWRILNRTNLAKPDSQDVTTWTAQRLVNQAVEHYQQSLQPAGKLQNITSKKYKEVLKSTSHLNLLPTLYDLLAERALNIFKNSEAGLTQPMHPFLLTEPEFFNLADSFVQVKIQSEDTINLNYQAIQLYQELTRFHLRENNQQVITHLDMKRLQFVHENSTHPQKDFLLKKALQKLAETTTDHEIKAEVLYKLAYHYYQMENGSTVNYWLKSMKLSKEISSDFPDSQALRYARNLIEKIEEPAISIQAKAQVSSQKPFLIKLDYKNIQSAYLKLYRISTEDFMLKDGYHQDKDFFAKKPLVKSWTQEVPVYKDYRMHGVEVPVEGLEKGFYGLLISDNAKFGDTSNLQMTLFNVTDLFLISKSSPNAEAEFLVTNAYSGHPVSKAKLMLYGQQYDYKKRKYKLEIKEKLSTNQQGTAQLIKDEYYQHVMVVNDDDTLITGSNYNNQIKDYSRAKLRTILFTDRAIYRPGQVVYFKGLTLDCTEDDCKPVENKSETITLYDPNRQELQQLKMHSNQYGTFKGSFTIPTGLLNGNFTLQANHGRQSIKVEEYKRPTFEVKFKEPEQSFGFNDSVKVSGEAIAFAGYPIDNALVSYRVVRREQSRWYWWYGNQATEKQVSFGQVETNQQGEFEITFFSNDQDINDKSQIFIYTITADVTDTNGETRSDEFELRISNSPLLVKAEITSQMSMEELKSSKISATNLNGKPVEANIHFEMIKLQAPKQLLFCRHWDAPDTFLVNKKDFRQMFPHRVYQQENEPEHWPEGKKIASTQLTKDNKIPNVTAKPGYYKIKIKALTEQDTAWLERVVQIISEEPEKLQKVEDWFQARQTKALPGEKVEFWFHPLAIDNPVRYELLLNNEVLQSKWLHGEGWQKISVPVRHEYQGGFAIQLVQVAKGHAFNQLQEIEVPHVQKQLDLKFTTFRDKLLPGQDEEWKLTVTNKSGENAMAEMVATLYDASLDDFAKLNWTTNFLSKHRHHQHGWKMSSYLAQVRSLYKVNRGLWQWSKTMPVLDIEFYYGSYNNYYHRYRRDISEKIRRKREALLDSVINHNEKLLQQLEEGTAKLLSGNGILKGRVIDAENGDELPGVNIHIPSTNISTVTDLNGEFKLTEIPTGIQLVVSAVGYETQIITAKRKFVDIKLKISLEELDEIVVEGYAEKKRSDITGAIDEVVFEEADDEGFSSADKEVSLQGRVAGGNVTGNFPAPVEPTPLLEPTPLQNVAPRTNFSETAFFYPHLTTNAKGEIKINFTIPEALTRWKMMGFAHTKDFKTGTISNELITQKDVSVMVNAPRFLREDDTLELAAKVNNLTENKLQGEIELQLFDALNEKPISEMLLQDEATQSFELDSKASKGLRWQIVVPNDVQAVKYRVLARAGKHTDGEEAVLPVLKNSKLVTESLPFMVKGGKQQDYRFDKMLNQQSTTLKNHAYTIEYTANPVWYAVQAMPYLMEFPYECSEQLFSRFFANTMATALMNTNPKIQTVFQQWQSQGSQALLSNLEKNQQLKETLLQETPWVLEAQDEAESKRRLALFFDLNQMKNELTSAFAKLRNKQTSNGGFAWFDGMPDNRYITQYIVSGLSRLRQENLLQTNRQEVEKMLEKAHRYLDQRILEDFERLLRLAKEDKAFDINDDHLNLIQIHYLYSKSLYAETNLNDEEQKAYDYFRRQAKTYWLSKGEYAQAMLAIVMHRAGETTTANKIVRSLKNRATFDDDLGMYWAENNRGYFWYQAPIETHAMLIEAFHEVAKDTAAVEEMKIWLLRNKQTSDWETTKATTQAIFALLNRGVDLINENKAPTIELNGKPLQQLKEISAEAGTGYVKTTFTSHEIKPEMGNISVTNPNQGIMWGAAYWQYFEQLDKVTGANTDLQIGKKLFIKKQTEREPELQEISANSPIEVGDEVVVRVIIRADRDYEYVHLKDMRASGFEPMSTNSGYRYQDGLGYYESVKDASINFFMDYLRKGNYVFEYSLRAVHNGDFSNGITTMQCMYAPEFGAHSEGVRVTIGN